MKKVLLPKVLDLTTNEPTAENTCIHEKGGTA